MKNKLILMALVFTLIVTGCSKVKDKVKVKETPKETVTETKGKTESKNILETKYPLEVKVVDAEGNEIVQIISKVPNKVVTSNVSSTEILLKLGLKDKIVGILKPDNKITSEFVNDFESLRVIGDKKSLSKELVLSVEPEIIIGRDKLFNSKFMGTIKELNKANINAVPQKASVVKSNPTLETVLEDVETYGKIFNKQSEAVKINEELKQKIQEADKLISEKAGKNKKVLAMVNFDGTTFGAFDISKGLQGNILKRLKLIPASDKPSNDLSMESLIKMNPDIILYISADRNTKNDSTAIEKLLSNVSLKEIPALKDKKVIVISYDDFMDYGMRTIYTYNNLAKEIYGK